MAASFFYQLINEMVLFDVSDCLFFGYSASSNVMNAVRSMSEWRFFNASMEVMTFFHKAPVTINRCLSLRDTYGDLKNVYHWWSWQDPVDSMTALTTNFLLNSGDIVMEL